MAQPCQLPQLLVPSVATAGCVWDTNKMKHFPFQGMKRTDVD